VCCGAQALPSRMEPGAGRTGVGGPVHHGGMSAHGPSIDEILTAFFAREHAATSGVRSRRLERMERILRSCLETDCDQVLDDGGASLLAAERVLEPEGAFARSMRADDLVFALVVLLDDRWLVDDAADRRLQVRLALRLVDFLLERRLIDERDLACPLIELKVRVSQVRAAMRDEAASAAH
jgi:hypothetical protein